MQGGGAGRCADRAGPGGAGAVGLHRGEQVCRLPAALPAGRYFRAAGIRDFARHAVGLVRGRGRPGRALVPAHGRAGAGLARGGHRRHRAAHAERGQDAAGADVGLRGRRRTSLQRLRLHPEPQPRRAARVSERVTTGCCWPMPTAATTAWWRATRSPARAVGRMRVGASSRRRRQRRKSPARPWLYCARLFAVEQQAKEFSVAGAFSTCARRNRRRSWPNCARNCCAGKSNCCPSIPWRRP